jgi:hypothetical protein
MKLKGKLATVITACGLAVGGIFAVSAPAAHASTYLGGVSVADACSNQLYIAPSAVRLEIIKWNVTGWRCGEITGIGNTVFWWWWVNIHLNAQCATQYGDPSAYASYSNYNNPYSWGCYR